MLCLLPFAALLASDAPAQEVRPEQVRRAIEAGVRWLRSRQGGDGSWPYENQMFRTGADALAVLALLNAGVSAADPDLTVPLQRLSLAPDDYTYNMSLKIAALARADPRKYRVGIERAARRLIRDQLRNGSWTYAGADIRVSLQRGDNSNTQFALYGLDEAARAGVKIDREVWKRAAAYWESCQMRDGGWGYTAGDGRSYGSMTAAGVASLLICGNSVARSLEHGYKDGVAPNCGRYVTSKSLGAGLNWLAKNIDVTTNPNHPSYHYYWLYALERAGILSGLKYFGAHDWYRAGAAHLVTEQRGDGAWGGGLIDTSFALLFLGKGRKPLLIHKLAWSKDQRWSLDRDDCEHLTAFIGDKLGEPVAWQNVPLDAPVEDWLEAPILYFNGHIFPPFFTDKVKEKLRRYVEGGGTILAEACCSRREFIEGFEKFAAAVFPEQPLVELGAEHAVWNALFELRPGPFRLKGIDLGCRTSVIFAPVDLSCLWEQGDVPGLSEPAFQLGTNIAAYVTGREPMRDRLTRVVAAPEHGAGDAAAAAPGALQLAQIIHDGDWRPDAHAMEKLAGLLNEAAGVDVIPQAVTLAADDPQLLRHPIAYMTGHQSFALTAAQLDGLRAYLERGGFLFADACCGREPFDKSFRAMCAALFKDAKLERIATNEMNPERSPHPLIRATPGYDATFVQYRPTLAKEQPSLHSPVLEVLRVRGRIALVYSPYGFTCGLEDHACYYCRGYVPDDARKVAANIVLFALTR